MSRVDAKGPETSPAIFKDKLNSLETSNQFFENQPNEICSYLSEKGSLR